MDNIIGKVLVALLVGWVLSQVVVKSSIGYLAQESESCVEKNKKEGKRSFIPIC